MWNEVWLSVGEGELFCVNDVEFYVVRGSSESSVICSDGEWEK